MKMTKRFASILLCLSVLTVGIFMFASCGECDHEWGEWTVTTNATCNSEGVETRVCALDESHTETRKIAKTNHVFELYVSDENTTCTSNGTKTAVCSNKDCSATDTVINESAKQHTFNDYKKVEATCTENAYKIAECAAKNCTATDKVIEAGTALGHNFNGDRICDVCGCDQPIAGTWDISADNSSVTATLFEIDANSYELSIEGEGAIADFGYGKAPWNSSVSKITTVSISEGITYIGAYSLYGLSKIETLTLPEGLVEIGNYGIAGCNTVTTLAIPASLEKIGPSAISGWSSLTDVIFSQDSSLTEIDAKAFSGCSALKYITLPKSLKVIGNEAFRNLKTLEVVDMPNSLEKISEKAFDGCKALTAVHFNDASALKYIGDNAFNKCETLVAFDFYYNVEYIGNSAFADCAVLNELVFANVNSVKFIGEGAFDGCEALEFNENEIGYFLGGDENNFAFLIKAKADITTATITASTMVIAGGAFAECTAITDITLPYIGNSRDYGEYTFDFIFTKVPATLKNVTFTDALAIPDKAFAGCSGIETITFLDTVYSIGMEAFAGCSALNLNEYLGAMYLGFGENPYAFLIRAKDDKITSATVSKDTLIVCVDAFVGCSAIESLTVEIGSETYKGVQNCVVDKDTKTIVIGTKASEIPADGSVVAIGDYAFKDCKSLKTLVIPQGIYSIGEFAFVGCTSLETVTIPSSVGEIGIGAFAGCSSIKTIAVPFVGSDRNAEINSNFGFIFASEADFDNSVVPSSIKNVKLVSSNAIADGAFAGCGSIESIELPDTLSYIGSGAFEGCEALAKVIITSLPAWCNITFADETANPISISNALYINSELITELVIPEGVEFVSAFAFAGASNLTSITIPASVKYIAENAFVGCTALTSVSIPALDAVNYENGVNFGMFFGTDENGAYNIPKSLKTIVITGGESIAEKMFINCTTLEKITIATSVKSIGKSAFDGCVGLKEVHISDINVWCAIDFRSTNANPLTFASNLYVNGKLIKNLVVTSDMVGISNNAFSGCTSLETVVIENGATTIGDFAFINCAKLTSVKMADSVTYLGKYAFSGCYSLKTVEISASLTEINEYTFASCKNIQSIEIPATVSSVETTAFVGCDSLAVISVDEANEIYVSLDGILYNKADCSIVYIPTALTGEITLLEGITSIKAGLFTYFPYVYSIIVPETVTEIEEGAFAGCVNIKSISVPFVGASNKADEKNNSFVYIFGTEAPASLATVTVTGSTNIAPYAFNECIYITSINLLGSFTVISEKAFFNCEDLVSVVISSTITSIEKEAFYGCRKLETVYYYGEEATWKEVTIAEGNASLTASKILFYSEEMPQTAGTHWYYNENGKLSVW